MLQVFFEFQACSGGGLDRDVFALRDVRHPNQRAGNAHCVNFALGHHLQGAGSDPDQLRTIGAGLLTGVRNAGGWQLCDGVAGDDARIPSHCRLSMVRIGLVVRIGEDRVAWV